MGRKLVSSLVLATLLGLGFSKAEAREYLDDRELALWNVGISAALPVATGIYRGDSWEDIAKNSFWGGLSGLGSYRVKKYVADDADKYIEMGICKMVDSVFSSMRMNAMDNEPLFSKMYFDYGPFVFSKEGRDYGFGIDLSNCYDIYRANCDSDNEIDWEGSLLTGVPVFSRENIGHMESGISFRGNTGTFGGAFTYKIYEDDRIEHVKHEMIHVLQDDELFCISRSVGPNYNPEFFGIRFYGLENLKGRLFFKKPFQFFAKMQGLDSYERHFSDMYWWEREAHGFVD